MTTGVTYNQFIDQLHQNGYRTTSLGSSETNFEQYGNALSASLKQEIMDSFDCEQDYELQNQIASALYNQNTSVINSATFMNSLKNMGLNVSISYQSTSYISDYKAGNFSGAARDGAIAVYTISDGKGGEIKIADANGNGSLEIEEIFMNQILGDINHDIAASSGSSAAVAGAVNNGSAVAATTNTFETSDSNIYDSLKNEDNDKDDEGEEVSQDDFNSEVEKYLKRGASLETATNLASIELGADLDYTGSYLEELEAEEEEVAA